LTQSFSGSSQASGTDIPTTHTDEWSDDEASRASVEIVKDTCPCMGEIELLPRPQLLQTSSVSARRLSNTASGGGDMSASHTNNNSNSTNKVAPSPSACTAILSVVLDTPRHVCVNVLRRLVGELTVIHDERQVAQRKDWDAFVHARWRSCAQSLPTASPSGAIGCRWCGSAARTRWVGRGGRASTQ